jgi:hypothetical protein
MTEPTAVEPALRAVPPDPRQPAADVYAADLAALPKVLKVVGAVVAPSTLLTGLLFYFGRLYATGMFGWFDVNVTVLDLTVQDYLIRSVDGLLVPLVALAGLPLLGMWAHQLLGALPPRAESLVARMRLPAVSIAGVVATTLALADLLSSPVFPRRPELRGVAFAGGVLLLTYAAHLARRRPARRRAGRSTGAVVFLLVAVGLFWAAGSYASRVGQNRAQQIEAALPWFPSVALYSDKRLNLGPTLASEVACQPGGAYQYRYDGLKLLLRSGDQYLLVPVGWTHSHGAALLLRRSDTLRLEFGPPGTAAPSRC